MTTPTVTALRARGPGRVAIDLDGDPWRVVPSEAVIRAGLAVGCELDRVRARALGRVLRRLEAQGIAVRALGARDHTRASLERRLTQRGTAPAVRSRTLDAVERAGLVDDERFAAARAALLAGRGAGDLLIADDLERQGVSVGMARAAIAALDPERVRAAAIIEERGSSAQTARRLAAKGFSEESLEALVADLATDRLG